MPKTINPLTRAKTSSGVSYTIPSAKLVDTVCVDEAFVYLVALDSLEEVFLDAAAREVLQATVPGYDGNFNLPVITWKGRTCLRVMGQFPPTLKGPDGRPRKSVKAGATVTMRAMLKAWPTSEGMTVVAYPSRIDVHGRTPDQVPTKSAETVQLAMPLKPPGEPVLEPAHIIKPKKTSKPKPAPKAKTTSAFDKAAFAAHRARVVEARARARQAAQAETPKPAKRAKTKLAQALPSNVIPFPVSRVWAS